MGYGQYSNRIGNEADGKQAIAGKKQGRQKQVFDADEIAHLWMHKAQDSARNAQGNFYFSGPSIYSYGSHFPIARHVEHKGKQAILFTTRSHSVTTAKHVNNVRQAIGTNSRWYGEPESRFTADVPVFQVFNPDNDTARNLADWRGRIEDKAKEIIKPRIRPATKAKHWDELKQLVADGNEFAKFFDKPTFKVPESMDLLAADLEKQARKEESKRKRDAAKTAKEYAVKRERERIEAIPLVAAWVQGFDYTDGEGHPVSNDGVRSWPVEKQGLRRIRLPYSSAYLRIDTDDPTQVETSQGARFPISHAKRAWLFVAALQAKGQKWERNGHTVRVGHFQLDSVDQFGNVKAGCHRVEWAEIERFGKILDGLKDEAKAEYTYAELSAVSQVRAVDDYRSCQTDADTETFNALEARLIALCDAEGWKFYADGSAVKDGSDNA